MTAEVAGLREGGRAVLAAVRLGARVYPDVLRQRRAVGERAAAPTTQVGTQSGMRAQVR